MKKRRDLAINPRKGRKKPLTVRIDLKGPIVPYLLQEDKKRVTTIFDGA